MRIGSLNKWWTKRKKNTKRAVSDSKHNPRRFVPRVEGLEERVVPAFVATLEQAGFAALVIQDQGPNDESPVVGEITYGGAPAFKPYGTFEIAFTYGLSKPNGNTPTNALMDLTFQVTTNAGGTLNITLGDTDFDAPPVSFNPLTLASNIHGNVRHLSGGPAPPGSSVTVQAFANVNNIHYGTGVTPGPHGPFSGPFSDFKSVQFNRGVGPYSLTSKATIVLGAGGLASADHAIAVTGQPGAAVGDRVWCDDNGNGIQDAGEHGVSGATVKLFTSSGTHVGTTTTNASGLYLFSGLTPGDYFLEFTPPAGEPFTLKDQGSNDAVDSDADLTTGKTAVFNLSPGEFDSTWDAGLLCGDIDIEKLVRINNGPDFDADNPPGPIGHPGDTVTFTYLVTNPGSLPLTNIVVTDQEVDPVTNAPIGAPFNPPPVLSGGFNVGDTNKNNLLDPGETWKYTYSITVTLGGSVFPVPTSEMSKYLLIGTTSNGIAKAVNVQNGDLGADVIVLSTEINDNVDFDLDDVFLHNAGKVWVDYDNLPNTKPDFLPGAATVGEGVSWTGDVALTSPNGAFDMGNVELYGQVGVVADSPNPVSSVSNSLFFPNGVGNGVNPAGGKPMPPNGVTANADAAMAALRAELDAFEHYVTNLAPEKTLSGGNGLPDFSGIEDEAIFEMNIDAYDTNKDGVAVIDIKIDNGNSDFKITNSNWIIEGSGSTMAIFRILGNSNLVLNQSTIVVGDGGIDKRGLGAIFIKANDYNNGQGGQNAGESLASSDTVFSFNNTVLNGVGFYDLIAFDEQNSDPEFDNGTTELKINDGQGCAQFISPKINFNDVRFERCSLPEGDDKQQHKNIATVGGKAVGSGAGFSDDDPAHWFAAKFQSVTVSGYKFRDLNSDGAWDKDGLDNQLGTADDEKGLSGWAIFLDANGNDKLDAGESSRVTDANGFYSFSGLGAGSYAVREVLQAGWVRTTESANFAVTSGKDVTDVNIGDFKGELVLKGDTATINFWRHNGQNLLLSLNGKGTSTALGNWLATQFPNMYGIQAGANSLVNKTNAQVATFFATKFDQGQQLAAQVLATALAVYVTDSDLAGGYYAKAYGLNVSSDGVGNNSFNIGANGAAFGLADNSAVTILDLLKRANDRAVNGLLWNGDQALAAMAYEVFKSINEKGGIP
jgi:hypothetical protein